MTESLIVASLHFIVSILVTLISPTILLSTTSAFGLLPKLSLSHAWLSPNPDCSLHSRTSLPVVITHSSQSDLGKSSTSASIVKSRNSRSVLIQEMETAASSWTQLMLPRCIGTFLRLVCPKVCMLSTCSPFPSSLLMVAPQTCRTETWVHLSVLSLVHRLRPWEPSWHRGYRSWENEWHWEHGTKLFCSSLGLPFFTF